MIEALPDDVIAGGVEHEVTGVEERESEGVVGGGGGGGGGGGVGGPNDEVDGVGDGEAAVGGEREGGGRWVVEGDVAVGNPDIGTGG